MFGWAKEQERNDTPEKVYVFSTYLAIYFIPDCFIYVKTFGFDITKLTGILAQNVFSPEVPAVADRVFL